MKIITKILIILFLFLNNSYSSEKIAFVDIDLIINDSDIGKKLNSQLADIIKREDQKFKIKEKDLKIKEEKILNQKNILSEEELNKKLNEFKKELNNFRNEKISSNKKLREQKLNETNLLISNLNNILANYAEEKSISLIIQKKNIVIGKSELDITNEILTIFNKEVKSIKK